MVRELAELIRHHNKPGFIVSDKGTELVCNAVLAWSSEDGNNWHFIAHGKPLQNGKAAKINVRMRNELHNETLFISLDLARAVPQRGPRTTIRNGRTQLLDTRPRQL